MSNLEVSLMATAALVAGPWLYARGFRTLRMRRLIAATPTARIRSLAMGLVEINGLVEPRSVLSAPFSGKPCAYWEIEIATRSRRGWTVVHRNRSGNPFFLRDETGVALVYPQGAECRVRFGCEEHCHGLLLPPCYAEYMNAHSAGLGRLARLGFLRFRERVLEAGQRVYVLGTATPRAAAHMVAEGEALQATGTGGPAVERLRSYDGAVAAVVRRGENESTFVISQDSEKGLMLDLGIQASLQLAGGPVLTLLGLGYWLTTLSTGRRPW